MPYATAITLREGGRLEMCEQNALAFYGRVSYDDEYEGLALDSDEGDRLANKLGNGSALFLASHGIIVTGRTVAEAFTDLYYLECAARAPGPGDLGRPQAAPGARGGAAPHRPAVRAGAAGPVRAPVRRLPPHARPRGA